MTSAAIETSCENGILTIRMNRPSRVNALTFASYRRLIDLFESLAEDKVAANTRAVVLCGQGPKGFCSGGDVEDIIGELVSMPSTDLLAFTRLTGRLILAIRRAKPPIIASLHGIVCGAGAVIASACDIRIGLRNTRFAFLFPKVGLSGADMGAAFLLPRLVGLGRANELLLTGDWIDADEAHRIGLLNQTCDSSVDDVAHAFARRLADGPRFANAMTKDMINREMSMSLEDALEAEAQAQAICMQHPDFREAKDAWSEKRKARFL